MDVVNVFNQFSEIKSFFMFERDGIKIFKHITTNLEFKLVGNVIYTRMDSDGYPIDIPMTLLKVKEIQNYYKNLD